MARRAVSRKKISLVDTGLAAHINHLDEAALSNLLFCEAFGAFLESYVVSELHKTANVV
ncbi:MAG: DUF4143 domain-containing protein [Actinomycetia bacterium]|nr:DUF4143 domain-containing protein [Actinomycetes bacterium]